VRVDNIRLKSRKDSLEFGGSSEQSSGGTIKTVMSNPMQLQQLLVSSGTAGKSYLVSSFALLNGEVNGQVDDAVSPVGEAIHHV
jgi:hypothetical protein